MQPRIKQPALLLPDALAAMQAFEPIFQQVGLPPTTLELVRLRASQINGCAVCCELHARWLRRMDTSEARLATVAAWRDAPYFTPAERAALALAEAVTRIADRENPVPDDVWAEAAEHYDDKTLSTLVLAIGIINVWNRFNVATHQIAGTGP